MSKPEETIDSMMKELGDIETEINKIERNIKFRGTEKVLGEYILEPWYIGAKRQEEPLYQRARYLHEVIMTDHLKSLSESSKHLEESSRRLTRLTWGLLALSIVLIALTTVLLWRTFV